MSENKSIELSDNVLVQCPERGFSMRKVSACLNCEFYKGIYKATADGELIKGNEANDFQIICARPITRKLIKIEVD